MKHTVNWEPESSDGGGGLRRRSRSSAGSGCHDAMPAEPLARATSSRLLPPSPATGIGWSHSPGSGIYVHGGRMSVAGSALPGIDADRVDSWLAEHVDGLVGPVEFGLVSGGRSNLTYRVTDASGATYALRRPPTGGVLSTAHDVSREWRFISALAPTAGPLPTPAALSPATPGPGPAVSAMAFVEGPVVPD